MWPVLELHVGGLVQYVPFCIWLPSLRIIPAWFIHSMAASAACPLPGCVVFHGTNEHNVFIVSPLNGLLQFRTILSKAARTLCYLLGDMCPLSSHPGLNLLGHSFCVSLVDTIRLLSKMVVPLILLHGR